MRRGRPGSHRRRRLPGRPVGRRPRRTVRRVVLPAGHARRGDIIQKFVNYRMGIVVLGDISRHTEAGSALRGLVRECDRGRQTWLLAEAEKLGERLKGRRVPPAVRPAPGRTAGGVPVRTAGGVVPPGGCALSRGSAAR
ncbi:DUF4180 domain-containing protein [Streptomyces sp. NBC_01435]|uniref:DUF4180 domain-containing protein n=1 Tax=Streptomyces sp. NBC_01435 TaxID=2903865 RepID=UPI002E36AAE3|nr:DUF4180 domain-containing protein [Streptomyces sp. NBC_01435]